MRSFVLFLHNREEIYFMDKQKVGLYEVDKVRERIEILKKYRRLLTGWKPKADHMKEDMAMIRKAFEVAADAHKDMRRKSGEPYIMHPLEVAIICADEIGLGKTSIVAALLHDVIEDTDIYKLSDIERMFGPKVAMICDGLTKIKKLFDATESSAQALNYRKLLETMAQDVRVILIKLADRLHNMRTLGSMRPEKQLKIAAETNYFFAPMAHRLGLYAIKSELEDLSLKYTEPMVFQDIVDKVNQSMEVRDIFAAQFLHPIKKVLTERGYDYKILVRTKSIFSIWQKMQRKHIPFDEVYDVFAIRIILDVPLKMERSACWECYAIVTDFYRPKPDRMRDWISIPKANGYQALHTTVMSDMGKWVEVQIRTVRMDEIAEKGYAAHFKYKGIQAEEHNVENWLNRIRDLLAKNEGDAVNLIDDFQGYLFNKEVFVFTPNGELRILPQGSTVLDFAYGIHSEVGNNCIGANVNRQLVSKFQVLNSGDQIEILTSKKQEPTEEWVKHVQTTRARAKIREALKEKKKFYAEDGRNRILEFLEQLNVDSSNVNIGNLQKLLKYSSSLDMFYDAYLGKLSLREIKQAIPETEKSWISRINPFSRSEKIDLSETLKKNKPAKSGLENLVSLNRKSNIDFDPSNFSVATCCNPIPGDDVTGFIQPDGSIVIHRTSCSEARNQMSKYGNNIVKTRWNSSGSISCLTTLKVKGFDRQGLLVEVSQIISNEMNINMKSVQFDTDSGIFEGDIMVYVSSTDHLKSLIARLAKVDGIQQVFRLQLNNDQLLMSM